MTEDKLLPAHIAVAALVCAATCAFGQSQKESELDQGLRYVPELQRLYFPDIADAAPRPQPHLNDIALKLGENVEKAAADNFDRHGRGEPYRVVGAVAERRRGVGQPNGHAAFAHLKVGGQLDRD